MLTGICHVDWNMTSLWHPYTVSSADTAKGAEVVSQLLDAPLPLCTLGFAVLMGSLCYLTPPPVLDVVNTLLVAGVVASFVVRLVLMMQVDVIG